MSSKPNSIEPQRKHPPGLHRMLNYGREQGKVGWILLWLLGVPIPVIILLWLFFGR